MYVKCIVSKFPLCTLSAHGSDVLLFQDVPLQARQENASRAMRKKAKILHSM